MSSISQENVSSAERMTLKRIVRGAMRRLRSRIICFGTLRSTEPVNLAFGIDRGTPVDRRYIDAYLSAHSDKIYGRVLEIGDRAYTTTYGGSRVTISDILNYDDSSPGATFIGRIENCPQIPDNTFDCIILTQTLHYVFNMFDAVKEIHRILKPGGSVLCTVPGLSQVSRYDMDCWGDRWRMTSLSISELFALAFNTHDIEVETYGNALAALCFIEGIPAEKLRAKELTAHDPDYQILVCATATKEAQ